MAASNSSHVLFASEDRQTFLIDIPTSIAAAQEFNDEETKVNLLSCAPVAVPYKDAEPKSAKARAKISNYGPYEAQHAIYSIQCIDSIRVLKDALPSGPFCLPRKSIRDSSNSGRKRTHSSLAETQDATLHLQMIMSKQHEADHGSCHLPAPGGQSGNGQSVCNWQLKPDSIDRVEMQAFEVAEWGTGLSFQNIADRAINIHIEPKNRAIDAQTFCLRSPPGSNCLLGPCHDVAEFRRSARQYSPQGRFDMITLDPPWPNRSASRKHIATGGYRTENNIHAVHCLLSQMDLDVHIKPAGYIALWITNKASCRDVAMGLFQQWNVALIEEWVYLKLAANGEPITRLDGTWRKPYEVLLIAQSPVSRLQHAIEPARITRRTIAAVPDLHSRKPCLKLLFQELLLQPEREHQDVLEIFARHLVAQWMSWGDEVLKYNWDGHWSTMSLNNTAE